MSSDRTTSLTARSIPRLSRILRSLAASAALAHATCDAASLSPAPRVVLEGEWPGHLQDVWWDGGTNLWWSHTGCIVRTDPTGKVLARADVGGHNAGLEVRDGRLYVTVCPPQSETGGQTTPDCHPQVDVYDAATLRLLERHVVNDATDRIGSLAILPDGSFLVGCLRPDDIAADEVRLHHLGRDFRLLKTVVLGGVEVTRGIETIRYRDGELFLCHYKEGGGLMVVLDRMTFTEKRRLTFNGSMGFFFDGTDVWCGKKKKGSRAGYSTAWLERIPAPKGISILRGKGVAQNWMLDKGCRIDGDILSVEVSAKGGTTLARAQIDLTKYAGRGVEVVVKCRGFDVEKPSQGWLGTKFMLHYISGGGIDKWPGAAQVSGSFGWRELRLQDMLASGVLDGSAELVLGLQGAAGRLEFDLSTLRVGAADFSWLSGPAANPSYRCEYTVGKSAVLPVLSGNWRGVMSPGRDMTEDDFVTLAEWGVNLLRFQIKRNWAKENDNRDSDEFNRWLDGRLDHLDRFVLPQALKRGIAVVVDLHVVPGGRSVSSEMNMFHEEEYANYFVTCWERIAKRFKGRAGIYGYDLVNEPMQREPGPAGLGWWALQEKAARAIRHIDPVVPIIVEANEGDSPEAFSYMSPLELTNVIYETHMYLPMAFTHQGVFKLDDPRVAYPNPERGWNKDFLRRQLKPVREFQLQHGAKIYAGEFSAAAWAPGADQYLRDCIALFEEYGWDWTYHAFRESPIWDLEKEGPDIKHMVPAADTPRMRVIREGLRR